MRRACARALAAGTAASLAAVALPASAAADSIVTNKNDSGPGSLREALIDSNGGPDPDTITFAASVTGTITVNGELPVSYATKIVGPGPAALTVKAPSLNSGRNDRPAAPMPTRAMNNRATAAVRTVRQYVNAWPSHRSYAALRRWVNLGSAPDAIRRDFGRTQEHSTGVTASATTSEAASATT